MQTLTLDFYLFGKNRLSKVNNMIQFQLQPEGLDISSLCFHSANANNKKIFKNFIGCVAHKGEYIRLSKLNNIFV